MSRKISTIIFDMDGVLVDAANLHYEALNRALGLFGYTISMGEHLAVYNGLPTLKKLEMLSRYTSIPTKLHPFISELKQRYTREEIVKYCVPVFEIERMIRQLDRQGYRLAVCSNSIRDTIHLMLKGSGIVQYFDCILSNEDVKLSKPNPEMYLTAFQKMNVTPEETVIVEDSPHGIQAAKASGAFVCEVRAFNDVCFNLISNYIMEIEK